VLYRRVSDTVTLVDPDGTTIAELLLHVRGDEAWRYTETPFDD
jgi:hypothetical protein